MKDQNKTKKQLIEELEILRRQLVEPKKGARKRKPVKGALQESEETFRTLAENANDGILVAIGDGLLTYANKRASKIMGYSVAELLKSTIKDLVHPDEFKKIMERYRKRLAGEPVPSQYETMIVRKDGRGLPIELTAAKTTWHGQPADLVIARDITERKRAEEALRESEERMKSIFRAAPIGIGVVTNRVLMDVNARICEITGYRREELVGSSARVLYPTQDDFDYVGREKYGQIAEKGMGSVETRWIRKDGTIIDVLLSSTPIDPSDLSHGVTFTALDITERKRAEEKLRESEKKYRTVVEISPDGIAIASKGRHVYVNQSLARIFGVSGPDDLLGKPVMDYIHPAYREIVGKRIETVIKREALAPLVEEKMVRADGTVIQTEVAAAPLEYQGEQAVLAIIRDITERKRAEQALRESEERFRLAFENANTGVCLVDLDGNLTRVNNKMCEIFGYMKEELERMTVNDIAHPEDIDKSPEFIQKTLRGEIDRSVFEKRYFHKKGHVVTCQVSSSLVRDANGSPLYFISHVNDITEHKRAEEKLADSEMMYRTLVNALPDGITVTDLDKHIDFVSPRAQKIFGLDSPDDAIGRSPLQYVAPEDRDRAMANIQRLFRHQQISKNEYTFLKKDGSRFAGEIHSSVITDASGNLKGIIGVIRDITEHKQTEEALKERQETIKAIIETSQDWIWAVDRHSMHTYSNPAIERILGYEPEEIVGRSSLDLMHEDDKKMVESILPDCEKKRHGWNNLLLRWRHKNGTYRYLESNAVPILNDKGDLVGFQGVDRDITERKKAEEALQKEREISLSILENAPYGVVLIDKGGEYIYINPEFTNITGYTLQDIPTGKDWFQKAFSDQKDRERMIQVWKKDRSEGNMINREFRINRKDGKTHEIETRSTFLRDGRAVMVLHDTTEQKRAEEEMKSLQEQLRQSQKMEAIGRLAGGIAHDFNNLLTIIKGYSQLSLIELKEDTPLKGNIEHIHTATDRAADLVRQLLAFSRRQILEMKVWDLNTILTNLHNMLRRLIGEDIELTTILGEDLGRVKTDLGWIEQAIMNLVVNARDAMPSGGKLTIETRNAVLDEADVSGRVGVKPGRYVVLSVSDTGVGMIPEVRERLFEPFFSTKEKDKGTGLGLSTVYGIVKQSGGDIWVYSEPGRGSTFKIYLPRVDEPPEQAREKVFGDELLRGSETILLVEDEEEVRKLAVRVLERQGYKVLAAHDGDEALLICERHQGPIHLMLTDIVMPGMNGHELAERLEPLHPEMKVLYMSGYTDHAIVLHGVLVEGVHYIQKPFTVDALTKKVREVLEQ